MQEGYTRKNMKNALKLEKELSSSIVEVEKVFKYPELKVYALDTLGEDRNQMKVLKLDLKRYFNAYVKTDLIGVMFQDLADFIERNIEEAINEENAGKK